MGVADVVEPVPDGVAEQDDRLVAYLRAWLGLWPPADELTVVGYEGRAEPGWDGSVRDVLGVVSPRGGVVSVRPDHADRVRAAVESWADVPLVMPGAVGRPEASVYFGVFRWCTEPSDLPDVGVWLPATDPRLPDWLRPFGGEALVVLDDDRYAAGVGLKRHNGHGMELAVGTDAEYRGQGYAARLCAQAARRILADGAVPIYLHDPANHASARTGAAAGFPDRGWQVLGLSTS